MPALLPAPGRLANSCIKQSTIDNKTMCVGSSCYSPPPVPPPVELPTGSTRDMSSQVALIVPLVLGCLLVVGLSGLLVAKVQAHRRWVPASTAVSLVPSTEFLEGSQDAQWVSAFICPA